MKIISFLARACASGLIAYLFPRILVAAGVPVDRWIIRVASSLPTILQVISSEQAIWIVTIIIGILLFGIDVWLRPVGHFFQAIIGIRDTKIQLTHALDCPTIILFEPEHQFQFFFQPTRNLQIQTETMKSGKSVSDLPTRAPIFRIKNIGDKPVENLTVTWRIADRELIPTLKSSKVFGTFLKDASEQWIELRIETKHGHRGHGFAVARDGVSKLRYLYPQRDNENFVPIEMPFQMFAHILSFFCARHPTSSRLDEYLHVTARVKFEIPASCPERVFQFRAICWRVRPLELLNKLPPGHESELKTTLDQPESQLASWGQIEFKNFT